jgi:hypothetical protein
MIFFLLFSVLPLILASALIGVCSSLLCGLVFFICSYLWLWQGLFYSALVSLIVMPWAGFFASRPLVSALFLSICVASSIIAIIFQLGKKKWQEKLFGQVDQMGISCFLADHEVQVLEKKVFLQEREEDSYQMQLVALLQEEEKKSKRLEEEISLLEEIITRLSSGKKSQARPKKSKEDEKQTFFPFDF